MSQSQSTEYSTSDGTDGEPYPVPSNAPPVLQQPAAGGVDLDLLRHLTIVGKNIPCARCNGKTHRQGAVCLESPMCGNKAGNPARCKSGCLWCGPIPLSDYKALKQHLIEDLTNGAVKRVTMYHETQMQEFHKLTLIEQKSLQERWLAHYNKREKKRAKRARKKRVQRRNKREARNKLKQSQETVTDRPVVHALRGTSWENVTLVLGDGHCMFRALAVGNEHDHKAIRQAVCDILETDEFQDHITTGIVEHAILAESPYTYIADMRGTAWGTELELEAFTKAYPEKTVVVWKRYDDCVVEDRSTYNLRFARHLHSEGIERGSINFRSADVSNLVLNQKHYDLLEHQHIPV